MYMHELNIFVQENRNDKNSHYMKIVYELFQKCFVVCTKVGLRNPILRGNAGNGGIGDCGRKALVVGIEALEFVQRI